ncbi:MAG: CCA tRNA nucleotidyltransferase [Verrucomicrobiota bacterium]
MRAQAQKIAQRLLDAGYDAVFAGGCVRDQILGKTPKDYDIATSATPDQVLQIFPKADSVGAHFGVILVKAKGEHFEIATFRKDGEYSDGRRPDSVEFSKPQEDAQRRDFTINGLFENPVTGEVIDYVDGQSDIERQQIRAIGNASARFAEDYLRMLRAIRFATVLGFEIEAGTWAAIQEHAHRIKEISPERIRDEIDKVWLHPNRVKGFDLLVASGLMAAVLPEILDLQGCEQPPQWHPEGDVFIHTRLMLEKLEPEASLPLVLSVLFHDIAKPATQSVDPDGRIRFNDHEKVGAEMTESILRRLRYSNKVSDAAVSGVRHHMQFKDVQQMKKSTLRRFMGRDNFADELALHKVDCLSSNGNLANHDFVVTAMREFEEEPVIPKPFLNGQDLMAVGIKPGPQMGELLRKAQDLQLEGALSDRDAALAWLHQQ